MVAFSAAGKLSSVDESRELGGGRSDTEAVTELPGAPVVGPSRVEGADMGDPVVTLAGSRSRDPYGARRRNGFGLNFGFSIGRGNTGFRPWGPAYRTWDGRVCRDFINPWNEVATRCRAPRGFGIHFNF